MSGHNARGTGSGISRGAQSWATNSCPSGKRAWVNRRDAKEYASLIARRGVDKMKPYYCEDCNCWHIGHLPRAVMDGTATRREYYGRPEQ